MKSVQLEEKLASGGMRAFLFRWPQFNEQNEQMNRMLEPIFGVELHLLLHSRRSAFASRAVHLTQLLKSQP